MKRVIARVPGSTGVPFCVVLVEVGDRYGVKDCVVHDGGRGIPYIEGWEVRPVEGADALVEFHDERGDETDYGQFVSRYFARTLIGDPASYGSGVGGLCLYGGVTEWEIDAGPMAFVRGAVAASIGCVAVYKEKR